MKISMEVKAKDRNTFVIDVSAGRHYRILAEGEWVDWWISTTARGFASPPLMRLAESRRRYREANWFALIAFIAPKPMLSRSDMEPHGTKLLDLSQYIDGSMQWMAPCSGSLHVFPNDVPNAYWNNKGSITLTLTQGPD